jgi:DNA-binding HxlR family transcriptional regulator
VPIVWTLYSGGPATFSELKQRLGASRETLSQTLDDLCTNGVVARPGFRRGTYSVTEAGALVGEACGGAVRVVVATETLQVALKKWPMLVLTAAGRGARRYGELAEMLPGITPRALAQALRDLEAAGLVTRTVVPGMERTPAYEPTERGRFMLPELDALVSACDDAMEAMQRDDPAAHPSK